MASTYLTRTPSTVGDQQTFTVSAWVKRAALGGHAIFAAGTNSTTNGYFTIYFSSDALRVRFYEGSSKDVVTSALYRDTSAWYHVVVKVDTTQATAADRVIIYVNGEEQDKASATYVSQNFNTSVNNTTVQHVGANRDSGGGIGAHFDGEMAHFHLTDGTAYAASTFGETDSTTGIWKPKTAPSVSYGSNGFFLKYENSSSMGTDSSGNSNTFTVNGTMTQTVDTPSNVYATLNPLTEKSKPTLSNGNLKCGSSSDGQAVYSTLPMTNGYYEMKLGTAPVGSNGTGIHFGVHNGDYGFNGWNFNHTNFFRTNIGYNTNYSVVNWGQGNSWENTDTGVSSAINDIIMVAWKDGYLYAGKNGTWFLGADPSAGTATTLVPLPTPTNPNWFSIVKSDLAGMGNLTFNFGGGYFGTTSVTSNSGAGYQDANGEGIFEYQVPTGCYAINTKNINAEEYS